MSKSKEGIQIGATKKFSEFRCPKCQSYLVPLTEEKMSLFGFTEKQKQRIREYPDKLTHFCPRCMKAFQRQENPVSEELENCPYCGQELTLLEHEGEYTDVLYCEECKKPFLAEEETLEKIQKLEKKRKQPSPKQISKTMQETE